MGREDELIKPDEVIERMSLEELCETAEEYYRRIPDATPLMAKPFAFLHETPEMLENLGLLLSGLHLGKTMTVLDFGAGTCWLSRYLTQLSCQVICVDTSQSALTIGARLYADHPPVGGVLLKPRFIVFDGRQLPLADASVDRIVCFDAFHHVPNQREVLMELGRVLRPGGIAGFSEPGRQHSRQAQSQYEMRNHKVLENDIDLNRIFALGREGGFTSLTVKLLNSTEGSLDDYNAMYGPTLAVNLRDRLWNDTYNTTFNRSIFFLHKGARQSDSRSHIGLAHSLQIADPVMSVEPGQPLRVTVSVTNTGTARWLHTNSEIHGIVRLGTHLYEEDGRLLAIDHSRHDLPRAVDPGSTVTMAVEVPVPADRGCRLAFDLVAEGVTWFETGGSTPVTVTVRRA
jgi:SAM-dependent methyltransferase